MWKRLVLASLLIALVGTSYLFRYRIISPEHSKTRALRIEVPHRRPTIARTFKDPVLQKMQDQLGYDEIGSVAFRLLKRYYDNIKSAGANKFTSECHTRERCSVRLEDFYTEALNRLSSKDFAVLKNMLQRDMIRSDLSANTKISLLTAEMLSPVYSDKFVRRSATKLLLLAHRRMLSLNPDPRLAIDTTLRAISNTRNRRARVTMINSLLNKYPQYRDDILASVSAH